ncbi:hypothetical protein CKAH01_07807 [Colletotrichum kahawae]|uniref:Uncharacterized protein n=1 Tax=Colletotrichum kahawae TaxID=34407 RepID=A0AAE0D0K4_COLKA|nr:hypothetical protein CKAH01_07807 [Colletotrichum kahawae]
MDSIAILCAWRLNPCTRALASSVQRSRNGNHGPGSGEELLETPRAALWDWAGEAGNARRREQIRQREQMRTVAVDLQSKAGTYGSFCRCTGEAKHRQTGQRRETRWGGGRDAQRGTDNQGLAGGNLCEACNCWAVPPCDAARDSPCTLHTRLVLWESREGLRRQLDDTIGPQPPVVPMPGLGVVCIVWDAGMLGCWDARSLGRRHHRPAPVTMPVTMSILVVLVLVLVLATRNDGCAYRQSVNATERLERKIPAQAFTDGEGGSFFWVGNSARDSN